MQTREQVICRLVEDILFRGMANGTLKNYTSCVLRFLEYSNKPVADLTEEDIRKFLLSLIQESKYCPSTINLYSAAVRFFFAVTLNRHLNYLQIPYQKKRKKLPAVLSKEEVFAIIDNCSNIKHKALLSIIYSSGLRISEATALKISHIDSKSMKVFVKNGKGGKDRHTILALKCLLILREYWIRYRPNHPEGWLFPGRLQDTQHISKMAITYAFQSAVKKAGITKPVSVHSLRHAFATHLLEDGVSLLKIKELLGHSSIQSTTIYLHLANVSAGIRSPFDVVPIANNLASTCHE